MPLEKIQTGSVRRKIIFVFLTFAIAFGLSFLITRTAFREMMVRVDKITIPDLKLKLVHQINRGLVEISTANAAHTQYTESFEGLAESLDSLASLYKGDSAQLVRIDSIQALLARRDSIFRQYDSLRQTVLASRGIQTELKSLERLVVNVPEDTTTSAQEMVQNARGQDHSGDQSGDQSAAQSKANSEANSEVKNDDQDKSSRGFFARLFNFKKDKPESSEGNADQITDSQIDSLGIKSEIKGNEEIKQAVRAIKVNQNIARQEFTSREASLGDADAVLIKNIFHILRTVEQETIIQSELENQQARLVVNQSISRISAVFLIVILAIAIMVYFILADIKKNNLYRAALENAKEDAEYHAAAKQRFLANMSHELRTPLQSIVGYAEQLKLKYGSENAMVSAIHHSSEHLLQIVNEVLDYSRINSGKIILEERHLDIREIIDNLIGIMQPLAQEKQLDLNYSLSIAKGINLAGDPYRIKQILFNLLSNAIKFTDKGSVSLDIVLRDELGNTLAELNESTPPTVDKVLLDICVADTGRGIAPKNLERIFDDFEQADEQDPTVNSRGSGLGLSIVKEIARSMGGRVTVNSELGKGATFQVILPLRVSQKIIEDESNTVAGALTAMEHQQVWVIDDDELILQLCALMLSKNSIPYQSFMTAESLLEAAKGEVKPDLVLMDIRMPKLDGFALNIKLREVLGDHPVRIFAFTAQALPEEQSLILSKGFDGILLKPFRERELLRLLGFSPNYSTNRVQDDGNNEDSEIYNNNTAMNLTSIQRPKWEPKIWQLFVADSMADLDQLEHYFKIGDAENLSFHCHRLAGRIGQFGHDAIAFRLRKMEIDSRNGELPTTVEFEQLTGEIQELIHEAPIPRTEAEE